MQRINILLIEDNPGDARLLRESLSSVGSPAISLECASRLSAGLSALEGGHFDAVLLDLSLPDSRGLETFDRVHRAVPRLPVVVLTGLDDEELALSAVARGAQDYLVKGSVNSAALLRILRFAVERAKAVDQMLVQTGATRAGKIIGFIGARGGSGTTTVALNVAAALSRQGREVTAIELSPYRSGFNLQTQMAPRRDLADLLALEADEITPAELRKRLVATEFGAQLLFAPQDPAHRMDPDPAHLEALLGAAAQSAEFVIVDVPSVPAAAHQAASRLCDPFVVVTERSPVGLIAGRNLVSLLSAWGLDRSSLAAVLVTKNPMSGYVSSTQAAVELGVPIVGVLPPAAEELEICGRKGVPLVAAGDESLAADSLRTLAERLTAPVLTAVEA